MFDVDEKDDFLRLQKSLTHTHNERKVVINILDNVHT